MGLLSIFAGKKPEDHEEKGDELFRSKAFGDARIEFERALHKIDTRFSEKAHLKDRIRQKLDSAGDCLALVHVENAEAMAEAGDTREAEELFELALGLAGREDTRRKITKAVNRLYENKNQNQDAAESASGHSQGESADYENHYSPDTPDFEDRDDAELFAVLLNALPAETAEAYRSYGETFARGYAALNRGEFDLAIEELSAAMEENRDDFTLIPLELATAYLHAEEHGRARDLLESFISQNPEETRAYQLLCELYWEAGEFSKAGALIESSPAVIRGSASIQLLDGETRFQSGDLNGAREVFRACMDEHGAGEIVLRALAKTCEAAGDIEEARALYAQIMNHCASCQRAVDPLIKRRFADLSLESGDTSSKLLDLLFSLVQEDPDNRGDYYLRIGRIYEKRGEDKEARRYLGLAGQLGQGA
ncbi:MAG: tetratricopeptide repeat protein [Desulfobacterales bacterium]